jgi:hypothetical protein
METLSYFFPSSTFVLWVVDDFRQCLQRTFQTLPSTAF